MASTSSQLFGDWFPQSIQGSTDELNKNWSAAFKTPLSAAQTSPIKPETTSGVFGSYMNSPDMQLLRDEKDPFVRMMLVNKLTTQDDEDKMINALERVRKQQYEDRIKMRPLEFQELMARKALDAITSVGDIPRRIAAIRQMYGPETIKAFQLPVDALQQNQQIRYFS